MAAKKITNPPPDVLANLVSLLYADACIHDLNKVHALVDMESDPASLRHI